MRRLNVRLSQIDECIEKSMFAFGVCPRDPPLQPGELLLLQLVKTDADRTGRLSGRINFALIFERIVPDYDGTISRLHWPNAGKVWPWIVYGSATVPAIPFSLDDLQLSRDYRGMTNPMRIEPVDEEKILPLIQGDLACVQHPTLQTVPVPHLVDRFGSTLLLEAIFNHDHIVAIDERNRIRESRPVYDRNDALAEGLKYFYHHRCQVCGHDFEPTYGTPFAESHHIQYLSEGGPDISSIMVVLCPNHHRIVHATNAEFNRLDLEYKYPNGLREKLIIPTHFTRAPLLPGQPPLTGLA
jgi:5-methylcytosine-specific restriction endonuclease McrA